MKAVLLAALVLCSGALAQEVREVPLKVGRVPTGELPRDRATQLELQEESAELVVVGPVASLSVRQSYTYRGWNGTDEAVQRLRTPPLAALCDYRVIAGAKQVSGQPREPARARIAGRDAKTKRCDRGIAEWIDEGTFRLSLFPIGVEPRGQSFRLVQVLPNVHGERVFRYDLPPVQVRRTTWRVDVTRAGTSRVTANLPLKPVQGRPGVFEAEARGLAAGAKTVELRLSVPPAGAAAELWFDETGGSFLATSEADPAADGQPREEFGVWLGPTLLAAEVAPRAVPDPVRLPRELVTLLSATAHALRRTRDPLAGSDATQVAAPGVLLLADRVEAETGAPGQVEPELPPGVTPSAVTLPATPAAPPALRDPSRLAPRPASHPIGGPPPHRTLLLFLPSVLGLSEHRPRSYVRSCFANQKTIIGAIEMLDLDHNARTATCLRGGVPWLTADATYRLEDCEEVLAPRVDHPAAHPLPKPPRGVLACGYSRVPLEHEDVKRWKEYRLPMAPAPPESRCAPLARIPTSYFELLRQGGYLQWMPSDPGQGEDTCEDYCVTGWGNGVTCLVHGEIQPQGGYGRSPRQQLRDAGVTDPALLALARDEVAPGVGARDVDSDSDIPVLLMFFMFWCCWITTPMAIFTSSRDLMDGMREHGMSALVWFATTVAIAAVLGPLGFFPLIPCAWHLARIGAAMFVIAVRGLPLLVHPGAGLWFRRRR